MTRERGRGGSVSWGVFYFILVKTGVVLGRNLRLITQVSPELTMHKGTRNTQFVQDLPHR